MQKSIKALFMRGGTSKGIFFKGEDLIGYSQETIEKILLRAVGSPDPYSNHMDGLGGATSSTSKVVIITPSEKSDCDIDYNFGAVPINGNKIDFSGNCGNLSAAAGMFAVEEGLLKPELHQNFKKQGQEQVDVYIYQSNIKQKMITKINCMDGYPMVEGDFKMAGLNNLGSEIIVQLKFEPEDNNLIFPTNNVVDNLKYSGKIFPEQKEIQATLVNVGNPTIFIRASDIKNLTGKEQSLTDPEILKELEEIRCVGAVAMGLGNSVEEINQSRPATPKIAFLSPGGTDYESSSGETITKDQFDFQARILSMGKLHHAFTATGAISLVAGAGVQGTIVSEFLGPNFDQLIQNENGTNSIKINFAHRSGVMDIMSEIQQNQQNQWIVNNVGFSRSARTLMKGEVQIPNSVFN